MGVSGAKEPPGALGPRFCPHSAHTGFVEHMSRRSAAGCEACGFAQGTRLKSRSSLSERVKSIHVRYCVECFYVSPRRDSC